MYSFLARMCFLCLDKDSNLESTYNKDKNRITIQEKLEYCVSEMATPGVELPTLICHNCHNNVNAFYTFKKLCLGSKKRLDDYINQLKKDPANNKSAFGAEIKKSIANKRKLRSAKDETDEETSDDDSDSYSGDAFEVEPDLVDVKNEPVYLPDTTENNSNTNDSFLEDDRSEPINVYKCTLCNRDFRTKTGLQRHMPMHTNPEKFKCTVCQEEFTSQIELKHHWSVHATEYPFQILPGLEDFPKLICATCYGHLNTFFSFKRMCLRNKKNLVEYIDEIKEKSSENCISFDAFLEKNDPSCLQQKKIKNKLKTKAKKTRMNKRGSGSEDSISYSADPDNYENNSDSECNDKSFKMTIKNSNITSDRQTRSKIFRCTDCNEEFSNRNELTEHSVMHASPKAFKCTICHEKFGDQLELKEHWSDHASEYPFQCKICDKNFTDEVTLSSHMSLHSSDRPYECSMCPKTFKDKRTLTSHLAIHSEDRPYMCTICGKRFRQKTILHGHINTHSGLKPFECDTCQKRFVDKRQLKKHMKTHEDIKPFLCLICDKRFKHKISLVNHIKEHNNEKQFECRICQKKFVRKMTLNRHEKKHEIG